jgi:hypothetical protein
LAAVLRLPGHKLRCICSWALLLLLPWLGSFLAKLTGHEAEASVRVWSYSLISASYTVAAKCVEVHPA